MRIGRKKQRGELHIQEQDSEADSIAVYRSCELQEGIDAASNAGRRAGQGEGGIVRAQQQHVDRS